MRLTSTTHPWAAAIARGFVVTGALVAALALQAGDKDHQKPTEHPSGKGDPASCLKEAAYMNTATIKFAQLGSQKAQSSELKRFSDQLERDHKRAQDKLEKIAQKHDVTLPTSLEPKCQEELTKLQALSGEEFDKEFAKGVVQGHAMAIAKLKEGSQAADSDLAEYSKEMLSQVTRHQEKAREVAKSVGLDQTTIAALETQPPEGVGTSGTDSQIDRGSSTSPDRDTDKTDTSGQKNREP
jgi:putative membrane protein